MAKPQGTPDALAEFWGSAAAPTADQTPDDFWMAQAAQQEAPQDADGYWGQIASGEPPAPSSPDSQAGLMQRAEDEERRVKLLSQAQNYVETLAERDDAGRSRMYWSPDAAREAFKLRRMGVFGTGEGAPTVEQFEQFTGVENPLPAPLPQGGATQAAAPAPGVTTATPHLAGMQFTPDPARRFIFDDPEAGAEYERQQQETPRAQAQRGATARGNIEGMLESVGALSTASTASAIAGPLAGAVAGAAIPAAKSLLTTTGPETPHKPSILSTIFDVMGTQQRILTGAGEVIAGDRPLETWYQTMARTAFNLPSYSGSEEPRDMLSFYRRAVRDFGGDPDDLHHIVGGLGHSIFTDPLMLLGAGAKGVGSVPVAQRQILGGLRSYLATQGIKGSAAKQAVSEFAKDLAAATPRTLSNIAEYGAVARQAIVSKFGEKAAGFVDDISAAGDLGRVGLRIGVPMTNAYKEILKPSELRAGLTAPADVLKDVPVVPSFLRTKAASAPAKTFGDIFNEYVAPKLGLLSTKYESGLHGFEGALELYQKQNWIANEVDHKIKQVGLELEPIAKTMTAGTPANQRSLMALRSDELVDHVLKLPDKARHWVAERELFGNIMDYPDRAARERVLGGDLGSPLVDENGAPLNEVNNIIRSIYREVIVKGSELMRTQSLSATDPVVQAGKTTLLNEVAEQLIAKGYSEADVYRVQSAIAPNFASSFITDTIGHNKIMTKWLTRMRPVTEAYEADMKATLAAERAKMEPIARRAAEDAAEKAARQVDAERQGRLAGLQADRVQKIESAVAESGAAAQRATPAAQMVDDARGAVAAARERKRVLSEQLTGRRQAESSAQKALTSARHRLDRAMERESAALRRSGGAGADATGDLKTEFTYLKREATQIERQLAPAKNAADAAYNRVRLFRGRLRRAEAALAEATAKKKPVKRLTADVERLQAKVRKHETDHEDSSRIYTELEQKFQQTNKKAAAVLARAAVPERRAALQQAIAGHDAAQAEYRSARDSYYEAKREYPGVVKEAQAARSEANVLSRDAETASRRATKVLLRESKFEEKVDDDGAARIEQARKSAYDKVMSHIASEIGSYIMHFYQERGKILGQAGVPARASVGNVAQHRSLGSTQEGFELGLNPADDIMMTWAARRHASERLLGRIELIDSIFSDPKLSMPAKKWHATVGKAFSDAREFRGKTAEERMAANVGSRDWAEFTHPYTGEKFFVPKGVAQYVNRMMELTNPGALENFIGGIHNVMGYWKGAVTHGRPLFYNIRNWQDDGFRMWMAGARVQDGEDAIRLAMLGRLDASRKVKATVRAQRPRSLFGPVGDKLRAKKDALADAYDNYLQKVADRPVTNAAGQTMTMGEFHAEMSRRGVFEKGFQAAEVTAPTSYENVASFDPQSLRWAPNTPFSPVRDLLLTPAKAAATAGKEAVKAAVHPQGFYLKRTGEFAGWNENVRRIWTAYSRWKRGDTLDDAAQAARVWNLDYKDLTSAERNYARLLAPFYAFDRKVIPAHIRGIMEHPGRYAAVWKTKESVERAADSMYGADPVLRPYLDQMLTLRLPTRTDKGSTMYLSLPLSITSLNALPGSGLLPSEDDEVASSGFAERMTPVVNLIALYAFSRDARRGFRSVAEQRTAPDPVTLSLAKAVDTAMGMGSNNPKALVRIQRDETGKEFETVPVKFALTAEMLAGVPINFGKFAMPTLPDTAEEERLRPFSGMPKGLTTRVVKELTGQTVMVNQPLRAEPEALYDVTREGGKLQPAARAGRRMVGQGTKP